MGKLIKQWRKKSARQKPIRQEIGAEGTVIQCVTDTLGGRVSVNGSDWPALALKKMCLLPGSKVYIVGRKGLVLHVIPQDYG